MSCVVFLLSQQEECGENPGSCVHCDMYSRISSALGTCVSTMVPGKAFGRCSVGNYFCMAGFSILRFRCCSVGISTGAISPATAED